MGHNRARDNRKRKRKRARRHACQAWRNGVQEARLKAVGVPWPREHFLRFYPVHKLTEKQVAYVLQTRRRGAELIRWRYYKDQGAYVAFTGNVPAFNQVVGFVRRFKDVSYPLPADCHREEKLVVGWLWEVRNGWFGTSQVLLSGFYHKFQNARRTVEGHLKELGA